MRENSVLANPARRCLMVAFLAVGLYPQAAPAALIGSCTIQVGMPGTLKTNPAIDVLGSRQPGGTAATATVTASSLVCSILNLLDCFSISAPAPSAFAVAPGGSGNIVFTTLFRLNGVGDYPGNTPVRLVNGTHAVQVDLTAARSTGVFQAGTYRAEVVIRCE